MTVAMKATKTSKSMKVRSMRDLLFAGDRL